MVSQPFLFSDGEPGFASPELVFALAESIPNFELQPIGDADNPVFHFLSLLIIQLLVSPYLY